VVLRVLPAKTRQAPLAEINATPCGGGGGGTWWFAYSRYICVKRGDVSVLVMGNNTDVTGYDKRTPELSNKPLHMKQNANSIEK